MCVFEKFYDTSIRFHGIIVAACPTLGGSQSVHRWCYYWA
jgi:hypothetical protein